MFDVPEPTAFDRFNVVVSSIPNDVRVGVAVALVVIAVGLFFHIHDRQRK